MMLVQGIVLQTFLFLCFSLIVSTEDERPCDETELPCDNSGCIDRLKWCDSVADCADSSDESYCFNRKPCLLHHFHCYDGTCIPFSAKCDGFEDCRDGSDEFCGSNTSLKVAKDLSNRISRADSTVINAVDWILNQRKRDLGWGDKTSRAVVALAFADDVVKMNAEEKDLIAKTLQVLLALDLVRNRTDEVLTPSKLALYINALYATCQDPANFQGVDLIHTLRKQVDAMKEETFSLPITLLTLCFAHKSTKTDLRKLEQLYWRLHNDRIGAKAITVMAMSCLKKLNLWSVQSQIIAEEFKNAYSMILGNRATDIYTRALYFQAMISLGYNLDSTNLLEEQEMNGSFKDLLATYYVIPVLVNSSLANLPKLCKKPLKSQYFEVSSIGSHKASVTCSVWIGNSKDKNIHSMDMAFSGNKTLFDIMETAEAKNEIFRFLCDHEKKVYSVAGIPDDAEMGVFWEVWRRDGQGDHLKKETRSLDKIFPKNNQVFIFWLKKNIS